MSRYGEPLVLNVPLLEGVSDEIRAMHALEFALNHIAKDVNEKARVIAWLDDKYGAYVEESQ